MNAEFAHKAKSRRRIKGLAAIFLSASMIVLSGCNPKAEEQQNTPPAVTTVETMPAPPPIRVVQPAPRAPETPVCAPDTAQAAHTAREMTAGEAGLVKALFNGELKADCVRLNFFAGARRNQIAGVKKDEKNHIEFYGKDIASADYSLEKDRVKFGVFIREMTHIWQNQTEGKQTLGEMTEMTYELDSQYVFASYSRSQQGAIMEDYALRFLHPSRSSHWLPIDYSGDRSDTDPFLQELVEGTFPSAKAAREAYAHIDSQALTPGEAAFLHSIFGDALDTSSVNKNFHPESYKDIVGSVGSGAGAEFWGPAQKSADFSKEKDGERFGTFVHEFTHVWQFQTHWQFTNTGADAELEDPKDPEAQYKYPLQRDYVFTDFSTEQQAAMVEDYARYYLHPSKSLTYLPKVYGHGDALKAKLPLLKKTVEDQFPAAKAAREAYERKNAAPKPVPVAERAIKIVQSPG